MEKWNIDGTFYNNKAMLMHVFMQIISNWRCWENWRIFDIDERQKRRKNNVMLHNTITEL